MSEPTAQQIDDFISRWQASGAAERANFPQFAVELCDLIGVSRPEPSQPLEHQNSYLFGKAVLDILTMLRHTQEVRGRYTAV